MATASRLPGYEVLTIDNDDAPVGRLLTRREALGLLSATGVALLIACRPDDGGRVPEATTSPTGTVPPPAPQPTATATGQPATPPAGASQFPVPASSFGLPSCVAVPALTEGPYFVDEKLVRSDIRTNADGSNPRPGVPLVLGFTVSRVGAGTCSPLPGAVVDVWHCDHLGRYSDVRDSAVGFDTSGQQFLRGQQVTDEHGRAGFVTVYPGWYPGRTVHIHFKVRAPGAGAPATTAEFTSQLFFDDSLTDRVYSLPPYSSRGARTVRNAGDGIYRRGGDQLVLDLVEAGEGYSGGFGLGLASG